jgi:site-specific DNA recombinase
MPRGVNALFLKDLAQKLHRGLEGRVREGRSGGDLCYGYMPTQEYDSRGERVRGGRRINAAEATVIVRIFTEYAGGKSPRAIAHAFNKDAVPGPGGRPSRTGRRLARLNPESA